MQRGTSILYLGLKWRSRGKTKGQSQEQTEFLWFVQMKKEHRKPIWTGAKIDGG